MTSAAETTGVKQSRSSRWSVNLALALVFISLNACGFVTAPVAHGSAWVAGTTVKAAEAGRKHGIRAASYLRNQALNPR